MIHLLRMAWRNVGRNRRRSLLAVVSVTIAIMGVVLLQGMTGGLIDSMVKNSTSSDSGHVRITTQRFLDRQRFLPVDENLMDPAALETVVRNDPVVGPEVRRMVERVRFAVLLTHGGKNRPAVALAGDPAVERDLLRLDRAILPGGRYLAGEREAIMGRKLAEALDYHVGDTLKVMAVGADHALHLRKFTIVGLFESGVNVMDERMFQIGLEDARKLLRMGDTAQQIVIMLQDQEDSDMVAARLRERIDDPTVHVASWTENNDIYRMVTFASTVYYLFYLCVALLGAIIIGNILMMVVMERRREIGVLRAMGFERGEIMVLFLAEGTSLGLIGSVVGVTLGLAVNLYFHFHGMDFSSMLEVGNFPVDNVIYPKISILNTLLALCFGTVTAALMSLSPSWRAARLPVAEVMRMTD